MSKVIKIRKKGIGKFIVLGAAKKEVRHRFLKISGLPFGVHFETRAEKMELDRDPFSATCFGSSPGCHGGGFGGVFGVPLGSFRGVISTTLEENVGFCKTPS